LYGGTRATVSPYRGPTEGAFRAVLAGVRGVLAMLRRASCAATVRDCYNDEIAARIHLEVFA